MFFLCHVSRKYSPVRNGLIITSIYFVCVVCSFAESSSVYVTLCRFLCLWIYVPCLFPVLILKELFLTCYPCLWVCFYPCPFWHWDYIIADSNLLSWEINEDKIWLCCRWAFLWIRDGQVSTNLWTLRYAKPHHIIHYVINDQILFLNDFNVVLFQLPLGLLDDRMTG